MFGALFARRIEGDLHLLSMATGESLAHINHLRALGELDVNDDETGVTWYRIADNA